MRIHPTILIIAATLILGAACKPIVDYPDEPQVSFTEAKVKDSTDALGNQVKRVTITFHLIDGNGDMGLSDTAKSGPFAQDSLYYHNLFIREFMETDGIFTAVPEPAGIKKFRMPDLTPSGQNKTLIADVSVTLEYPWSESMPLPFKTFRYEFFVVDRALNHSNTDTTSVLTW